MKNKWISLEESEAQRKAGGQSTRERLIEHSERLKTMLLEQRIRKATADATNAEQKTEDQRESLTENALAEHDTGLLENYHGALTQFFILGTGAVFAFCIGGLILFGLVILLGIIASI